MLALLTDFGADVDRPGGETWRGNVPLRTPYQHAVLRGRDDLAAERERLGARTDVHPADRARAAIARGAAPATPIDATTLDPDTQEVLILTALRGGADLDRVVDAVGPDFRGVVVGSPSLPLLGHAAWIGNPAVVEALLARGADPLARGNAAFDTPLAIAALASRRHGKPERDYVAVADLLLAAGSTLEPRFLDVADGPLADRLQQHLT
jgi:ankyrin repeat protein